MHKLQELVRLHRMGTGARERARLLQISPNTERSWRQAFEVAGVWDGLVDALPTVETLELAVPRRAPPQQTSSLEDQRARIVELMNQGAEPRAIFDRLRVEQPAFEGSYWATKRLCRRLRRAKGVQPEDVAIPVETAPGEVAQVDFGAVGVLFDPDQQRHRKAWVFVMVLGHSRHLFAKIVFDQTAETWQQLHVEAFAWFGGVPQVIVPDNLKAAVIRAVFSPEDDPALQMGYCEVARHYGFKIDPTPPYDPGKKGKVEAAVKYVSRSFVATMPQEADVHEVNRQLRRWLVEVAGQRLHGTTFRRPLEEFEATERAALLLLPAVPFRPCTWKKAKVHRDSHIVFERRLYSVPWRWIGQEVWVNATPDTVTIYAENQRVADHPRRSPGGRSTVDAHLPDSRADFRQRGRKWWEDRAAVLGEEVAALVGEMFDSENVLSPLRRVQALVTHLETFPRERANQAARRARHFGTHDVRGVKDILRKGLEKDVLPELLFPEPSRALLPRFARSIDEMLKNKQENVHEYH